MTPWNRHATDQDYAQAAKDTLSLAEADWLRALSELPLLTPCAHCGRPAELHIPDTAALAAFILLGALCGGCAARQETARDMGEGEP